MQGVKWLMAMLLYGAGLRVGECLGLRVKDVDLERGEINVREGKGRKDRVAVLPGAVKEALAAHLIHVREVHGRDLRRDLGRVPLPGALARKYPNADENGPGSGSSQRRGTASIHDRGIESATTSTSQCFRRRSGKQPGAPISPGP